MTTTLPEPDLHELPGGGRIAARCTDSGPAVVLLHGVGSGSGSFWPQFAEFGATFALVAWDAFGYGRSDEPTDPARLDDYADAVADLLAVRGHADAHVVGVSWGGVVATRFALRHTDRVRTLTLVSSTYGRENNHAVLSQFDQRIAGMARAGAREWTLARLDKLVSPQASPELRERVVRIAVESVRVAGYRGATQTLAATDHRPDLGQITAPTLVLCGDRDPITGPAESRVLADGIPGAEYRLVSGGGHLLNQDRPEVVNAALDRHWRSFDGEGVTA